MGYTLHCGDSLEIARTMPESSVDTIITDPPYGLKFMGKAWDHGVPGVAFWQEFLRVAKPGAILMAFGGTRTFHRLTVAIEDAGWEIRDCMMWLYGSGFPKSHDISKAIDKQAGAEREVIGINEDYLHRKPNGMKTSGSTAYNYSKQQHETNANVTTPNTDKAKEWDGWGTALKPAWEPIIIAMKPLDGTFANNALTHGVAGLHIDASRIGTESRKNNFNDFTNQHGNKFENGMEIKKLGETDVIGRFPANLILDEDSAEMLDEQSGVLKSRGTYLNKTERYTVSGITWHYGGNLDNTYANQQGGASRFFYVAKASRKERGEDNNHPTVKPIKLLEYLCRLTETPTGGIVFDPFMGSGSTGIAALLTNREFIGIDIAQEYVDIAAQRMGTWQIEQNK